MSPIVEWLAIFVNDELLELSSFNSEVFLSHDLHTIFEVLHEELLAGPVRVAHLHLELQEEELFHDISVHGLPVEFHDRDALENHHFFSVWDHEVERSGVAPEE